MAFIRGSTFWEICLKNGHFGVQTGEWASMRAWASNIIIAVIVVIKLFEMEIYMYDFH